LKPWAKTFRSLAWLTQLGLSIAAPPLLCVWVCLRLQSRFSLGSWVVILGILLGLGGSISSAMTFYRMMMRRQNGRSAPKRPDAFNDHE